MFGLLVSHPQPPLSGTRVLPVSCGTMGGSGCRHDRASARASGFNFLLPPYRSATRVFWGSQFGDRDGVEGRDVYADDAPVP